MFLQGCEDAGGGREPGIEDVRIDNVSAFVERCEGIAHCLEKAAAMEATSRLAQRKVKLPINLRLNPVEHFRDFGEARAQLRNRCVEQIVRDRA